MTTGLVCIDREDRGGASPLCPGSSRAVVVAATLIPLGRFHTCTIKRLVKVKASSHWATESGRISVIRRSSHRTIPTPTIESLVKHVR